MKIHHTKLLNKECIILELPIICHDVKLRPAYKRTHIDISYSNGTAACYDGLTLDGNWNQIGKLSELTDEDCDPLVESWESKWKDGTMVYENYADSGGKKRTALESFFSALEAEGLFLNGNPYQMDFENAIALTSLSVELSNSHSIAEQRTVDKTRTILLIKN